MQKWDNVKKNAESTRNERMASNTLLSMRNPGDA